MAGKIIKISFIIILLVLILLLCAFYISLFINFKMNYSEDYIIKSIQFSFITLWGITSVIICPMAFAFGLFKGIDKIKKY